MTTPEPPAPPSPPASAEPPAASAGHGDSDSDSAGDDSDRRHRALVIFSGGQDSTTCLFWALQRFADVRAVSFAYDQRHRRELDCARDIARLAGVPHDVVDLGPVFAGSSPLTAHDIPVAGYASAQALPGGLEATFVPGRNILFLTVAANRAYTQGCDAIVIGVSQEDFGGYPDCRGDFLDAMAIALSRGLGRDLRIVAPLLDLDKRQTVDLAAGLPRCLDALALSHTCYNGAYPPCGGCHACLLRQRGFDRAGIPDPLLTRAAAEAATAGDSD